VNRFGKLGRLRGIGVCRHWPWLMAPFWAAIAVMTTSTSLPAGVKVTLLVVMSVLGAMAFVRAAARRNAKMAADAKPATPQPARFTMLSAHGRVCEAESALSSQQYYFPVVQGRAVVGVLSRAALSRALADGRGDHLIAELMLQTGDAASGTLLTRVEAR
jgi:hypothetical protein